VPPATPDTGGVGLILKALDFAARKHRDQRRKDKRASPYINHPIQLAQVLWEEGGVVDPVTIAAALLHCQGDPKFPHLWELKIPHPVHDSVSSVRTSPALSFSLRR
jgi:hypothetical protein